MRLKEAGGGAIGVLITDKSHVPGCDDALTAAFRNLAVFVEFYTRRARQLSLRLV